MKKETSYHRLKRELKEARQEINRLKNIITDDNEIELRLVKKCTTMERDLEKVTWMGNTSEFMDKYNGLITLAE